MTDAFDAITAQRAAFLASGGGRVCLGNAAGDLDSVVSALAAAALYGGAALARFPREDLALRRDAEAALAHDDAAAAAAGAAPALAAPSATRRRRAAACEVVLTDHNAFDGGDASLAFASPATVVAVLLRLDYKRASAGRLRVGAASIMAPLSDFRAARAAARLGAALRAAAKSGVDVLFAMTAAEQGAKGLAYVVRDGARRDDGFGLAFGPSWDADGASRCSRLRADITRKTVLPFVLHVLGELAA
ncbi:pyrophosphatase [Aureococcus anophagefferens]|nr:pyrophosphatase [Aureococcus anophagefferens]